MSMIEDGGEVYLAVPPEAREAIILSALKSDAETLSWFLNDCIERISESRTLLQSWAAAEEYKQALEDQKTVEAAIKFYGGDI